METKKCDVCEGPLIKRKATSARPYNDRMSGLDTVFLVGIDVRECKKCGVQVPIIPNVAGLHAAIAEYLTFKQDLLSGKEIQFLRKNAGIPAKEFAELIGVDPAHLSRVENGKTESLGAGTDKLARAVAMAVSNRNKLRQVVLSTNDDRLDQDHALFTPKKDHWEKLAA